MEILREMAMHFFREELTLKFALMKLSILS